MANITLKNIQNARKQRTKAGSALQGSAPSLQGSAPQLNQPVAATSNAGAQAASLGTSRKTAPVNAGANQPVAPQPQPQPQPPQISAQLGIINDSLANIKAGAAKQNQDLANFKPTVDNTGRIDAIKNLSKQTDEERGLQDELSQFRGDAQQAIAGREGQGRGIPLNLIRGEQGMLLEQGQLQEQTLLSRLGNLQGQRQNDLEAEKLSFGLEDAALQRQDKQTAESSNSIFEVAQAAASRGASEQEVQAILNSGSRGQALRIATPFLQEQAEDKQLSIAEAEKLGVPIGTTLSEVTGIVPQKPTNGGELSSKQTSVAIQLSNNLKSNPVYTDMLDVSTGLSGVRSGISQANGFGDITAINAFQRMVDPGATVRSEDVALLREAGGFVDKVLSDFPIKNLQQGDKLPAAVRDRMMDTAIDLYNARLGGYATGIQPIKNLAEANGIDFTFVGTDFSPVAARNQKQDVQERVIDGVTAQFTINADGSATRIK